MLEKELVHFEKLYNYFSNFYYIIKVTVDSNKRDAQF